MRRKTSSGAKRKATPASSKATTAASGVPRAKRRLRTPTIARRSAPITRVGRGGSQALAATSTNPSSRARISLLAIDVDLAERVDLAWVGPLATVTAHDLGIEALDVRLHQAAVHVEVDGQDRELALNQDGLGLAQELEPELGRELEPRVCF